MLPWHTSFFLSKTVDGNCLCLLRLHYCYYRASITLCLVNVCFLVVAHIMLSVCDNIGNWTPAERNFLKERKRKIYFLSKLCVILITFIFLHIFLDRIKFYTWKFGNNLSEQVTNANFGKRLFYVILSVNLFYTFALCHFKVQFYCNLLPRFRNIYLRHKTYLNVRRKKIKYI